MRDEKLNNIDEELYRVDEDGSSEDLDFNMLELLAEIEEELGIDLGVSTSIMDEFEDYDEYNDVESLYEVKDYVKNYDSYEGSYNY